MSDRLFGVETPRMRHQVARIWCRVESFRQPVKHRHAERTRPGTRILLAKAAIFDAIVERKRAQNPRGFLSWFLMPDMGCPMVQDR